MSGVIAKIQLALFVIGLIALFLIPPEEKGLRLFAGFIVYTTAFTVILANGLTFCIEKGWIKQ